MRDTGSDRPSTDARARRRVLVVDTAVVATLLMFGLAIATIVFWLALEEEPEVLIGPEPSGVQR